MKNFYKKRWFWILCILAGIVAVIFIMSNKKSSVEYSSALVERVDLVQSVEETGAVTAVLDISYGFEMNGRVAQINKKIGDNVKVGDIIARIENTTQINMLKQAQAALAKARAAFNLKIEGASDEEIRESLTEIERAKATLAQAKAQKEQVLIKSQTAVQTAERALETAENDLRLINEIGASRLVSDAYDDLFNILKSLLPSISDALRESDNILGIDNTAANDNFEFLLGSQNSNTLTTAKQSYTAAKEKKLAAENMINNILDSSDQEAVDSAAIAAKGALAKTRLHLIDTKNVLDNTTTGSGLSEAELDNMKSSVIAAQTSINTKVSDLTNGIQAVDSARNSLSSKQIAYQKALQDLDNAKKKADADKLAAEANISIQEAALAQAEAAYAKLTAPPREVDLGALRADISKQQAAAASAQKELDRTYLRAIIDGILSKLDIDIGENITANQPVITLISPELNIEVDISESDVPKISINDPVDITLDAFGDDTHFSGRVISVEPAETEISGVIYYKTKIVFDDLKEQTVKSGMTANIRIITDKREDILAVPSRAILSKGGKKIVRVLKDKKIGLYDEYEVKTGMRGDEGKIEIISGLEEGQEIITFIRESDK